MSNLPDPDELKPGKVHNVQPKPSIPQPRGQRSDTVLNLSELQAARRRSRGRGSVGVAQHGVEGAGEVVGQRAAAVVLGQRNQAGKNQQQQEEQLEGERRPHHPGEEGAPRRRVAALLPAGTQAGRKTSGNHEDRLDFGDRFNRKRGLRLPSGGCWCSWRRLQTRTLLWRRQRRASALLLSPGCF